MRDLTEKDLSNYSKYIESCGFFSGISKEKISEILSQFEVIEIKSGETLFPQGSNSDCLYILAKGKLISLLQKSSGATKIIGSINPVETVGELGAISGEPRSLTVEAVMDSELLKLSSDSFKNICQEFPAVMTEVCKFIIQRSLQTLQLVAHEEILFNVSIILPLTKMIEPEVLKYKFKSALNDHDIVLLSSGENSFNEIEDQIKKSYIENRKVFIFMDVWKENILKAFKDKLNCLYIIYSEGEKINSTDLIKNISDNLKNLPNARLELILVHPETTQRIVNTRKWLEIANFNLHHHLRINNDEDFSRIIRFMTDNAFTLVLGGGGAKGLVHLGVIKAVLEKGISIDAIGGTSIGATIGACYAFSQSLSQTVIFINQLKKSSIQALSSRNLTWPIISLYSSNPATSTIINLFNNACIEDFLIPYFAVSTNMSEKCEKIHRVGLVWEALRSSASIPGIFPPVVFDGQLLFDGGLLNNLPVDTMREVIGSRQTVMASSLSKKTIGGERYNFPPVIKMSDAIFMKLGISHKDYIYPPFFETFLDSILLGSHAREEKNCFDADILVKPNLSGFKMLSIIEKKEPELIERGYQETIKSIDTFLELHPHFKK